MGLILVFRDWKNFGIRGNEMGYQTNKFEKLAEKNGGLNCPECGQFLTDFEFDKAGFPIYLKPCPKCNYPIGRDHKDVGQSLDELQMWERQQELQVWERYQQGR